VHSSLNKLESNILLAMAIRPISIRNPGIW
jgi:hypothetical protein